MPAGMGGTEWPTLKAPRTRRYIRGGLLTLMRPLVRYSTTRDAYVLRLVGSRWGPVLRVDRRSQRRRPAQLVTE
jgi:hypothetical protein